MPPDATGPGSGPSSRAYGYNATFPVRGAFPGAPGNGNGHHTATLHEQRARAATRIGTPTPLPKRPKGRWFVGLILLLATALIAYAVWNSFYRYRAFGVVAGYVLNISPTVEGVIQSVQALEGQRVSAGQLLMTLDNLELRQRHEQLSDDLKIAQAELLAATAQLRWQSARQADNYGEAATAYHEVWARLEQARGELRQAEIQVARIADVYAAHAATEREVELLKADRAAKQEKVEKLETAVAAARQRVESSAALVQENADALAPRLARIETLNSGLARVREQLAQCQVLSPVDGLLVKHHLRAGQRVAPGNPLLSILEDRSIQAVVYLPQRWSQRYRVGDEVELEVQPRRQRLRARVARLDDQWQPAPDSIARNYHAGESLLPVYLTPIDPAHPDAGWDALRVGEVVKLPYF